MFRTPSVGSVLLWFMLLAVLAVLVTCAAFAVFVPGPDRGITFYIAASIVCTAELVLWAQLLHTRLAARGVPTATPPVRIQIHALAVLWLLAAIVVSIIALNPERADTFGADRAFIVYVILTFLFFLGAYFLYARDIAVERMDRATAIARREVQSGLPNIEYAMRMVRDISQHFSEHAIAADRVHKKLDTVRSALEGVLVTAGGTPGFDWDAALVEQVNRFVALAELPQDAADAAARLEKLAQQTEIVLSTIRKRERAITT